MSSTEKTSFKRRLQRIVAGTVTIVVIAIIFGLFSMFHLDRFVEQLELKTYDLRTQLQWGKPTEHPDPNIVILQFDDASLNALSDDYGVWPWPRDVHAHMIDFLNGLGVHSLLYDIMFVSHRKGNETGDQLLVNTFARYRNVYLSMNFDNELDQSRKLGKDLTPIDIERLRPISIQVHSELNQAPADTSLKLKKDADGTVFFDNDHMTFNHYRSIMPELLGVKRNIGIINHGADEDGISRSNPIFFRFQYQAFHKSVFLPLTKRQGRWYDNAGNRTDADGYRLQRSAFLPSTIHKDGTRTDHNPNGMDFVDNEGIVLDAFGTPVYERDAKLSTLFLPYLGLRAALEDHFNHTIPPATLTAEGHLRFPGYDIPLRENGDYLVRWYNVNLTRQGQIHDLGMLKTYGSKLQKEIATIQTQAHLPAVLENTPDANQRRQLMQGKLNQLQTEQKKIGIVAPLLQQSLDAEYYPQPYKLVSAWEVIRIMKKTEAHVPLNAEDQALEQLLKGKTVFIGATAVAAYDIKNTSLHASMPGVVLQTTLFDNIRQNHGSYIRRLSPKLNMLITALLCILAAACTLRMRSALTGMLLILNIAVIYVLIATTVYQEYQLWLNIAMPVTSLVITTLLAFILKYILRDNDYEKTYALATIDSMTNLYNHRFFQEHMVRSIEQSVRFKHKFSLVLIDIDFFKKFNDAYGHQAGDEVLRHVARKLQSTVRNVDIVARYGGEEMAVVLERATEEEALLIADKIVKAIAEEAYPIAEGVAKHVTISCGVATYPTHGQSPSTLIEFADNGLYRAKENGRNQVGSQFPAPPESKQESA